MYPQSVLAAFREAEWDAVNRAVPEVDPVMEVGDSLDLADAMLTAAIERLVRYRARLEREGLALDDYED